MNVWVDIRDWSAWAEAGSVTDGYMSEHIRRVKHVEPYSLEELFGDDHELKSAPDDFREWYLTEDCDNALCQTAQAEEWMKRWKNDEF